MRKWFDEQLGELNNKMIEMGALIERAIARSVRAFQTQDKDMARSIQTDDRLVDEKEKEIESLCLRLLLEQQPVARDLRMISTALKIITDMERIGDHAADIAEQCIFLSEMKDVKQVVLIPQMAQVAVRMVTDSIDAYVRKDLELAREVIAQDDQVDAFFVQVKEELMVLVHENTDYIEQTFDLMQIAKYLERIGDHAENIAEWVIFSITGKH